MGYRLIYLLKSPTTIQAPSGDFVAFIPRRARSHYVSRISYIVCQRRGSSWEVEDGECRRQPASHSTSQNSTICPRQCLASTRCLRACRRYYDPAGVLLLLLMLLLWQCARFRPRWSTNILRCLCGRHLKWCQNITTNHWVCLHARRHRSIDWILYVDDDDDDENGVKRIRLLEFYADATA